MNSISSIWLDCDPGLDDALAIVMAAHHERINLIGISTSAGNTSLEYTTRNALDLLYNLNKHHIPVVKGSSQPFKGQTRLGTDSHGEDGLGGVVIPQSPVKAIEENSFQFIYDKIMQYPQPIIWTNTGSLTNLCLILRTYPKILTKIQKIVIMGGAIGRGNSTPAAQFNIYFDPHAFDEVLRLKQNVPLVMVPLDTTNDVLCKDDIFQYLESRRQIPLADAIYCMLRSYQKMYKESDQNIDYPIIHDPTVMYYLLYPQKFIQREVSYGRTNVWFQDYGIKLETVDKVTLKLMDVKGFWETMTEIFQKVFDSVKI